MSRRIRTAALLSTTALLVGGSFSLALAPAASAADDPSLGQLSYSPETPEIGDELVVTGTGCVGLNPTTPTTPASGAAAADPAGEATVAPAAADPLLGSVTVTVTGPGGFNSVASVETNQTGNWTSNSENSNITLQSAGNYSISASCQLAGVGIYDYRSVSFTVEEATPPPTQANPTVVVNPASGVTPGSSVSVTGIDFQGATTAAVSLTGYTTQNVAVDATGGFSGVTFVIRADQSGGTLNGTVTPDGGVAAKNFSVVVSTPDDGTDADGPVPTDTSASGGGTNVGSGSSTSGGTNYTSSKPTLPNTGADTLWPGVIGGLLVLSGAGLIWSGRRREQAEPALPTV